MKKTISLDYQIPHSAADVFDFLLRKGSFERMIPPWAKVKLISYKKGEEIELALGPFSRKWVLKQEGVIPDQEYYDVQLQGPFRQWKCFHTLSSNDASSCHLEEEIIFDHLFDNKYKEKFLKTLHYRRDVLSHDLDTYLKYPKKKLRILLSGASGFIGKPLKAFLEACGHDVVRLSRGHHSPEKDRIYWNPSNGKVNSKQFEGFDAVIHLAGKNIASGLWTKKRKNEMFLSRCRDTWLLSQVLSHLSKPPKTFISPSAIGYYGSRGEEVLTEESESGEGYLADLCRQWERATGAIEEKGVRVVHPRLGAVLSPSGGMLQKMLPAFRLGLGGKIGNGQQYISWIAMDDVIGAIYHFLMDEKVSGPVNLVSPHPIRQEDFAKALAAELRRPAFFNIPEKFIKWFFKEMGQEVLLTSVRAEPEKLIKYGYTFRYPKLQGALKHLL